MGAIIPEETSALNVRGLTIGGKGQKNIEGRYTTYENQRHGLREGE